LFAIRKVSAKIRFGDPIRGTQERKLAAETTRNEVLRLGSVGAADERSRRMGA